MLPYQERVVLYCSFIQEVSANLQANEKQATAAEEISRSIFSVIIYLLFLHLLLFKISISALSIFHGRCRTFLP
jgi:hypothetical protein